MAQQFKIHRVTALPSQLEPGAVYLVAPSDKPDYVEMYVVNNAGDKAKRIINEADIKAMISAQIGSQIKPITEVKVVDTYAQLLAIESTDPVVFVYVKDATESGNVATGGALYAKTPGSDGTGWTKISEVESLDLVLSWDKIQGKPNVTATQIEQAVAKTHDHSNKTQLDKIGEDTQGNFTYNGTAVNTQWTTTDW